MGIPSYPASRPLELGDKPLLDGLFGELQPRISELTFANLYLFRTAHAYGLSQIDDVPVVSGQGYDGTPYALPPLSPAPLAVAERLLDAGATIYGADERLKAELEQIAGLEITEDRDNFDYLYLRDELAELPGNRFHKKKNRVNYFCRRHDFVVEEFSSRHLDGCQRLLDEWARVRAGETEGSMAQEIAATAEALQLMAELQLSGVVVLVGGEVKAFALGERLNRTTAVCHFEKADPFLEGLSQLINREFSRLLFTDCTLVNREQDLGETGLREAKLSYHPVEIVKKFRLNLAISRLND